MKRILLILLAFITFTSAAQTTADVVGKYDRSQHGDPQGFATLFVLENHKYAIIFFGGAQVGTWNIGKNNEIQFVPMVASQRFTIYGRHNPNLSDSTRISFMNFTDGENYVQFGKTISGKTLMKRVFNESPNCLSFPYVHKYNGNSSEISFVNKPYQENPAQQFLQDVYTFKNNDNYNDFIAYYFKIKKSDRPFTVIAKKGGFFFSEDDFERKEPLPTKGEDAKMIESIAALDMNPAEVYFNPFYGEYDKDVKKDILNYTYNSAKEAYISPRNYTEGEEFTKLDDSFNDMDIIYLFKNIKTLSKVKKTYITDEVPIFNIKCNDEQ